MKWDIESNATEFSMTESRCRRERLQCVTRCAPFRSRNSERNSPCLLTVCNRQNRNCLLKGSLSCLQWQYRPPLRENFDGTWNFFVSTKNFMSSFTKARSFAHSWSQLLIRSIDTTSFCGLKFLLKVFLKQPIHLRTSCPSKGNHIIITTCYFKPPKEPIPSLLFRQAFYIGFVVRAPWRIDGVRSPRRQPQERH